MNALSWMAWTWPTALFFLFVVCSLIAMSVWEYFSPGGSPRRGVLGLDTTRGDRLFISYLGSGYIHLAWLFLTDYTLWAAVGISFVYSLFVFRFV